MYVEAPPDRRINMVAPFGLLQQNRPAREFDPGTRSAASVKGHRVGVSPTCAWCGDRGSGRVESPYFGVRRLNPMLHLSLVGARIRYCIHCVAAYFRDYRCGSLERSAIADDVVDLAHRFRRGNDPSTPLALAGFMDKFGWPLPPQRIHLDRPEPRAAQALEAWWERMDARSWTHHGEVLLECVRAAGFPAPENIHENKAALSVLCRALGSRHFLVRDVALRLLGEILAAPFGLQQHLWVAWRSWLGSPLQRDIWLGWLSACGASLVWRLHSSRRWPGGGWYLPAFDQAEQAARTAATWTHAREAILRAIDEQPDLRSNALALVQRVLGDCESWRRLFHEYQPCEALQFPWIPERRELLVSFLASLDSRIVRVAPPASEPTKLPLFHLVPVCKSHLDAGWREG